MSGKGRALVLWAALSGLAIAGVSGLLLSRRSPERTEIVVLAGDLRNSGVLGVAIGRSESSGRRTS